MRMACVWHVHEQEASSPAELLHRLATAMRGDGDGGGGGSGLGAVSRAAAERGGSFRLDRPTFKRLMDSKAAKEFATPDAEVLPAFKALDINGDGVLSREELASAMERLTGGDSALEEVREAFDAFDVDKGGTIDYEVRACMGVGMGRWADGHAPMGIWACAYGHMGMGIWAYGHGPMRTALQLTRCVCPLPTTRSLWRSYPARTRSCRRTATASCASGCSGSRRRRAPSERAEHRTATASTCGK